ncbi:hypothetical protein [Weissella bombi]|uniref:Uncharacterized protein n=1 Tax=Weissella bombi TaxID=1505725 RepID=A0A1C4B8K9_9LACO|nr:hypothetical protein [Weissella bombi]SCC03150.1 hypothetical protein GA0061074_10939 [Weissella bombi]
MKKIIAILLFFIMIVAIQIPTLGEVIWNNENSGSINYLNHFLLVLARFLFY